MNSLITVDVICQHSADGTVIPLRLRMKDEDGQYQTYTIKKYRDLSHRGTCSLPDHVYVTNNTFVFECKITAFGKQQTIRLYYRPEDSLWRMTC